VSRRRFDASQLRITRGALTVAGLQIGLSLVFMLSSGGTKQTIGDWVVATPASVFREFRVWTLATSVFLELDFLSLLLGLFMLWAFIPTLERFWGTARFWRFFAITSVVGTLAGTGVGLLLGRDEPIVGISPFIYASMVAFGIVYAKQPVQFFGVLPLTGRQLMYGFIGFLVLYVVLQQAWDKGAAFAAAMIVAAIMTSKRASPGLAWKRWRIARARARLSVIEGGALGPKPKPKKRDEKYLN
jgi:membrane associated rhomboid family serine protease